MIGSCLVDTLIRANREVNKNYRIYALSRNYERLAARFGGEASVSIIAQDISKPIEVEGLDYIIHAASAADPRSYALYPEETIETNILGAKSVLDYCRRGKTRALLTSTFEVYGKLNQDEYDEADYGLIDENQLRSAYPESKRVAELMFRACREEYGVDSLIARLPSVYGPTMSAQDNKAHAEFIRSAIRGEDIVLKSVGLQKRTYCYVMDTVTGLLFLLFHGHSGEAYNIANSEAVTTIADLANRVANMTGTKVVYRIPNQQEQKGYSKPQNIILKTDKIRRLGWQAAYGLDEGLKETIAVCRQYMNGQ